MKKKPFLCATIAALIAVAGYYGYNANQSNNRYLMTSLNSVEAISGCESIGWWNNDGNCVKNSLTNEYFCKDDGAFEFTDCVRPNP